MKKAFFTVLMAVVTVTMAVGQRIDIDRSYFDYKYRRLPSIVLDNTYTTYSVEINKTKALEINSNTTTSDKINIEGRTKVETGGSLLVKLSLSDLMIESVNIEERVVVNKDKDGKETSRSYYYKAVVVYTFGAEASITDVKNNVSLASVVLTQRSTKKTYNTDEFSKRADAQNYYNNNTVEIKTRLAEKEINEALASLNERLALNLAYSSISTKEYLWATDSKKHPENTKWIEVTNSAKAVLATITSKEVPQSVIDGLEPAIQYYTEVAAKYANPEEKAEIKIRFAAYYNIAQIYFLTDRFDKANEYALKVVQNDYDKNDGENMTKEINALNASFAKHNIKSRHFLVDIEKQ